MSDHIQIFLAHASQVWQSFVSYLRSLIQAVGEFRLRRLLQKGHKQIDLGFYQAALKSIKKAQKLRRSHPEVLYALGLISYLLDDYESSAKHLSQALQINPSHQLAQAFRGWAYQRLGLTTESIQDLNSMTSQSNAIMLQLDLIPNLTKHGAITAMHYFVRVRTRMP